MPPGPNALGLAALLLVPLLSSPLVRAPLAAAVDPTSFAVAPPQDLTGDGALVAAAPVFDTSNHGVGGVQFPDGTRFIARKTVFMHVSSDLSTVHSVRWISTVMVEPHPDGAVVALHYDDSIIAKYASTGTALTETTTSCDTPFRVAIQHTGNQRIFVLCEGNSNFCQYDSDLTNEACTFFSGTSKGIAIAPDDSFLVVRDGNTLEKYTINDGAGTLTAGPTLDISGVTTSSVSSLVVLSDYRVVVPDLGDNQLEVIAADFVSISSINVNSGPLGGITPTCSDATEVATTQPGDGDVFLACDGDNSVLVISNDLSTTAIEITALSDIGVDAGSLSFSLSVTEVFFGRADASGTQMFFGGQMLAFFSATLGGTAGLAGTYGTPLIQLAKSDGSVALPSDEVISVQSVTGAVLVTGGVIFGSFTSGTVTLASSDLSTVLDQATGHNEISQLAAHPADAAIVIDYGASAVHKYTKSGSSLVGSSDSNSSACNKPSRAAIQQTGNQRIFVMCVDSDNFCQYDSDLSNRACTDMSEPGRGIGIAPDDSFLVVRSRDELLVKYTINNSAGTVTQVGTLSVASYTGYFFYGPYTSTYSLAVLSDDRVLVLEADGDHILEVNAAFNTVNIIDLNDGTLGGITPNCDEPLELLVGNAGAGDVIVACQTPAVYLIISNDLSTTAYLYDPLEHGYLYNGFTFDTDINKSPFNLADAAGTRVALCQDELAIVDMTGSGTAGLGGSYATPLYALRDYGTTGVIMGTPKHPPVRNPVGVVDFGDGSMAVAMGDPLDRLFLTTTDFVTLLDTADVNFDFISQMVAHPDNTAIVLDANGAIYKYSSDGSALTQDVIQNTNLNCNNPRRAVVQQTGNQRIFVMCVFSPDGVCQYDADLSIGPCVTTTSTAPQGLGIAPDDSFIVIRDDDILRKYTINDGLGTLTAGDTLNIAGSATASTYSLVVLSDYRMVIPDRTQDQLEVVNAAFTTVTTINVNSGSLGGITPKCNSPEDVATDVTGLGDVAVACDASDNFLILSNDLSTTAQMVDEDTFGAFESLTVDTHNNGNPVGFLRSGEMYFGADNMLRITGIPPAGAGGDPVVTDLAGHRFVVGTEPYTEYLLLESPDGVDKVSFRTSGDKGVHRDYFIDTVTLTREGCGSVTVQAERKKWDTVILGEVTLCMAGRVLRGDHGVTATIVGDGSVAVVIVPHHDPAQDFSFINVKLAGDTHQMRKDGWAGILGDEEHLL